MRTLTSHKVNGCNEALAVLAVDDPGSGGANHRYHIVKAETKASKDGTKSLGFCYAIEFQNGPIAEVGTNGLTHESLLAILEDRLAAFQSGPFECTENERALYHIREAMGWLKHRTEKRSARGVEGTHTI